MMKLNCSLEDRGGYNKSVLPSPLTPLASAPGVKGSLALRGAAELNRWAYKKRVHAKS